MKGFIIAGISPNAIRQAHGLESQLIKYTPVIAETQEDAVEEFKKECPEILIIMTMPTQILEQNIKVVNSVMASLAKQQELELS